MYLLIYHPGFKMFNNSHVTSICGTTSHPNEFCWQADQPKSSFWCSSLQIHVCWWFTVMADTQVALDRAALPCLTSQVNTLKGHTAHIANTTACAASESGQTHSRCYTYNRNVTIFLHILVLWCSAFCISQVKAKWSLLFWAHSSTMCVEVHG